MSKIKKLKKEIEDLQKSINELNSKKNLTEFDYDLMIEEVNNKGILEKELEDLEKQE